MIYWISRVPPRREPAANNATWKVPADTVPVGRNRPRQKGLTPAVGHSAVASACCCCLATDGRQGTRGGRAWYGRRGETTAEVSVE